MIDRPKAMELDVVELMEDLPQYGLSKGSRGTVVEAFSDPEEAYMIEFHQGSGRNPLIADWVLPVQIENLEAQAQPLFETGLNLLTKGEILESVDAFRKAVSLKPSVIRVLHKLFSEKFAANKNWEALIWHMRLLIEIDETYELAKQNLAIGLLNLGVQMANEKQFVTALDDFLRAFSMPISQELIDLLKQNITSTHVALGVASHQSGDLSEALRHMQEAYKFSANNLTRRNLGLAYLVFADKALENGDFRTSMANYILAEDAGARTTEGLNNRAVAHLHLKEVDQAIRCLKSALILDPHNTIAQANLNLLQNNRQALKTELLQQVRTEQVDHHFTHVPPGRSVDISSFAAA